jgi:hypothetical protein
MGDLPFGGGYADIDGLHMYYEVHGDPDIITPEHAVDMIRQLGGGVVGDLAGLPASRLAILPGTTHVTAALRSDLLPAIIAGFLEAK